MTSTQPRDAAIEQTVAAPPEKPSPRPLDQKRIAALDGIRGFAILLIIFWHYYDVDGQFAHRTIPAYVLSLTHLAWTGIDFFFVLSGFLIGGILLEARQSPAYYKTFYIWGALGGKLASSWLLVTWTIGTEEQFYLIAPAMIKKISPPRLPLVVAAAVVFALILRVVLYSSSLFDPRATLVLMPARADAFMLGVGAALLVRDPRGAHWLVEHRRSLYLFGLAVGIVLLVFTKVSWGLDTYGMSTFGFTCTSFFYVALVHLAVSHPEGPVGRFFNWRPL